MPLDVLRGRSCLPMAVQAAEIALFRHLGETAMAVVRVLGHRRDGELTTVDLAAAADRWTVSIRTTLGDDVLLTCRALRPDPLPSHQVVAVERLGAR